MKARRHLIAALSEDSMGGIATLADVDRAEQLVDAHRAEVLDEVAEIIGETVRLFEESEEAAVAAGALEGLADRFRRMAQGKRPPALAVSAPDFFRPGRTYAYTVRFRSGGSLRALFRVVAVSESPDGRQRVAQGWRREDCDDGETGGWEPADADDVTGWVDVTEAGAR